MGLWQDDNRHGNGIVVTLDGMYFEGNFVQGKLSVCIIVFYFFFSLEYFALLFMLVNLTFSFKAAIMKQEFLNSFNIL